MRPSELRARDIFKAPQAIWLLSAGLSLRVRMAMPRITGSGTCRFLLARPVTLGRERMSGRDDPIDIVAGSSQRRGIPQISRDRFGAKCRQVPQPSHVAAHGANRPALREEPLHHLAAPATARANNENRP